MFYLFVIILFATSWFLPWWWVGVWGFLFGFCFSTRPMWVHVFLATLVTWCLVAFYLDSRAYGLFSERLALMIGLPHRYLAILLSAGIGAVVAALFTLSGRLLRQSLRT